MKKLITLFSFLLFFQFANTQTIEVDPDSGSWGETLTVTISGDDTEFTQFNQGSSSLNVWFTQGSNTVASEIYTDVISDTEIETAIFLHPFSNPGLYDVLITDDWGNVYYSLEEGFQVYQPFIESDPVSGEQGETLDVTLAGENTLFYSQGTLTVWFSQGSNTLYPTSTDITDNENATASLAIPVDAPCGEYTTNVSYGGGFTLTIEDNVTVSCNDQILGAVFIDDNQDNVFNTGETTWQGINILVEENGSSESIYVTTDANGNFFLDLEPGTYTLTIVTPEYYLTNNAESIQVTVGDDGDLITGADFALTAADSYDDLEVSLSSGPAYAGYANNYWVMVNNPGTNPLNGTVTVTLDELLSVESTSMAPVSENGTELVFEINDLPPNQQQVINIVALVAIMPGEEISSFASVVITQNGADLDDETPENNTAVWTQEITSSFDPNDKLMESTGNTFEEFILLDETLIYTVRFQNSGTAPAFNIRIEDPIDNNLDISTLQVIGSSHPYQHELTDDYKAIFYFNDINLPADETAEDPDSHGFIKFSIEHKSGLEINTDISNTAFIYFDFNEPIETNTITNTLVEDLPNSIHSIGLTQGSARPVPNPMVYQTELVLEETDNNLQQVNIYNINGRLLRSQQLNPFDRIYIDRGDLTSGLYLFEIVGEKVYTGKLLVQ